MSGPSGPRPGAGAPRVHIDRSRCQGHARCAVVAPELFALDELGNARPVGDGTVPPDLVGKARLAEASCPEIAIAIIEATDIIEE